LLIAANIVPGVHVPSFWGAVFTAAVIGVLNALLPPVLAALRLPFTLITGFLLVLVLDALILQIASNIGPSAIHVDSFWSALLAVLIVAAASLVLQLIFGADDDDEYTLRVVQRIARRTANPVQTDVPGILFLEIDGLALPVLRRAMRDGTVPTLARWIDGGSHRLVEWETDLSSQTGASQAGILLGSNDDIPAFRWVEKETGRQMSCGSPADCAEIERRHASGQGLLVDGGASRGNLLSGEAEESILTASRMEAEKRANPGYRAFFANGFNVTRALVLVVWEAILEWTTAAQAKRRDVRPRGHRGGTYAFVRAAVCVVVRDLTVYGVMTDMMKGRPAVYATFSSYDEVAHHSGLERADTLEVLRKLDRQIGRIERARRYAPRPYEVVVLSDHGQTQGATFKQRNGYTLGDLVERSLTKGTVAHVQGGDENASAPGRAFGEATGRSTAKRPKNEIGGDPVIALGSGNLGLVYLMEDKQRLTLEQINERHPQLIPALRQHQHIGWLLVHSADYGPMALGPRGTRYLVDDRVEGEDPLASFSSTAAQHLRRADGFAHAADITVNSFYDPYFEQGCAFEELISFHGGMGGPQTQAFILHPAGFPLPPERLVGAEQVHQVLVGWRRMLQAPEEAPRAMVSASAG
jgi:uncharacterized membrane protein YvlD (DUF360 family)